MIRENVLQQQEPMSGGRVLLIVAGYRLSYQTSVDRFSSPKTLMAFLRPTLSSLVQTDVKCVVKGFSFGLFLSKMMKTLIVPPGGRHSPKGE